MRTHSLADLPGVPKRFDRLFWHTVRMSRFGPDIHFARTYEIQEPYRSGRAVLLHLEPFRTALVIGWYSKAGLDEYEALRRAVSLRTPTQEELDDFDDDVLHGPGKPGGLRFSATRDSQVRRRGSRPGVVDTQHARAER